MNAPTNAIVPHPDFTTQDRRTVFLPELKSRFLDHLSEFGNVALACKRAGVSRQTAYRERRRQPAFARLWDAAMLAARTVAEEALAERAVHGVEEPVFYHGEEVGHRRRYSDRLLLAHLARLDKVEARPETADALAGLDDAIEALARGEEPAEGMNGETARGGADKNDPLDTVPPVPLEPAPPCETCGGPCDEPNADLTSEHCMWLGNRLDRMNAARPLDAPSPGAQAGSIAEASRIENVQLEAFECGVPEWWLIEDWAALDAALAEALHP